MQDFDGRRGCGSRGKGSTWEFYILFTQLFCEPKTILISKIIFLNKNLVKGNNIYINKIKR